MLDPEGLHPRGEMIIPTMISGRTTQTTNFVDELKTEFDTHISEEVPKTQNIPTFQDEGQTLFVVNADELYATGQRAQ